MSSGKTHDRAIRLVHKPLEGTGVPTDKATIPLHPDSSRSRQESTNHIFVGNRDMALTVPCTLGGDKKKGNSSLSFLQQRGKQNHPRGATQGDSTLPRRSNPASWGIDPLQESAAVGRWSFFFFSSKRQREKRLIFPLFSASIL